MSIPKKTGFLSNIFDIRDANFFSNPTEKELAKMEIQCFDSPWSEKDYIEMKQIPFFNGWLLTVSEKYFVGILAFNIIFQELEILRLGISNSWRRKGLAKLMLDRIELFSRENKIISIFLEVHFSNNSAISLYLKKGYKEVGRRRNYFQRPSGDAILLRKFL